MRGARVLLPVLLALLSALIFAAVPRPYLGDANCLSCHGKAVPVLPNRPCISCHARNMEFLEQSRCQYSGASFWVMIGVAGAGILALATLGILGFRRTGALLALVGGVALASPEAHRRHDPPLPGAFLAASGPAADLGCIFSPSGDAALFQCREPDTDLDGAVGLDDGQALFLWRKGDPGPVRVTGYLLDFSGTMAAWAPDGSRFAVPVALSDTDGDGALTRADRTGLALFDLSGHRLATLPANEHDLLNPYFSGDGARLAFADGEAIGIWDLPSGARSEALSDLTDGSFPRLSGWDPSDRWPVFTRGYEYAVVGKGEDRRYALPEETPLEAAVDGKCVALTPPGPKPIRRSRAVSASSGIAYMGQEKEGLRGLFVFDGASETRWTPADVWVYAFEPCTDGGFWAWTSAGKGKPARLTRIPAPGKLTAGGGLFAPSLLCLSAGRSPLACGRETPGEGPVLLRHSDVAPGPDLLARGAFFFPSCSGSASAVVLVREDTDGDGERTPLDEGELWMTWSAP